jgi:hypothetical protein
MDSTGLVFPSMSCHPTYILHRNLREKHAKTTVKTTFGSWITLHRAKPKLRAADTTTATNQPTLNQLDPFFRN